MSAWVEWIQTIWRIDHEIIHSSDYKLKFSLKLRWEDTLKVVLAEKGMATRNRLKISSHNFIIEKSGILTKNNTISSSAPIN